MESQGHRHGKKQLARQRPEAGEKNCGKQKAGGQRIFLVKSCYRGGRGTVKCHPAAGGSANKEKRRSADGQDVGFNSGIKGYRGGH